MRSSIFAVAALAGGLANPACAQEAYVVGITAALTGPPASTYAPAVEALHYLMLHKPAGVVTTIGGLAQVPGSADGVGVMARFDHLRGIAVNPLGVLYVADSYNNHISQGTAGPLALPRRWVGRCRRRARGLGPFA